MLIWLWREFWSHGTFFLSLSFLNSVCLEGKKKTKKRSQILIWLSFLVSSNLIFLFWVLLRLQIFKKYEVKYCSERNINFYNNNLIVSKNVLKMMCSPRWVGTNSYLWCKKLIIFHHCDKMLKKHDSQQERPGVVSKSSTQGLWVLLFLGCNARPRGRHGWENMAGDNTLQRQLTTPTSFNCVPSPNRPPSPNVSKLWIPSTLTVGEIRTLWLKRLNSDLSTYPKVKAQEPQGTFRIQPGTDWTTECWLLVCFQMSNKLWMWNKVQKIG